MKALNEKFNVPEHCGSCVMRRPIRKYAMYCKTTSAGIRRKPTATRMLASVEQEPRKA
eukprot:CAMPEP_0180524074 /NCGR_PEP_ID=MMETSP1036_2-20121128/58419_1 /TAXON_ID=632150 /ORGANISM="Azadinium spinosum, Strain 3D9" /LENGTH=57 /DNA_ID=CAMNT_0022537239 /DNA_START=7 /DNA_END=180 /DNA_ORIENTATION=-